MPVAPARAAAFDILLRVERQNSYASELLHSRQYEHLSVADHALATELVMGVLRWRSVLDDEIAVASSNPISKLDLEILVALRLGLYQLRHLDRMPARAALHESVELVKRARKRSAAPFVNAVLRKLSAKPAPTAESEPQSAESLAHTYSHPPWLVARWIASYGVAAAQAICKHDQSVPTTPIRLRSAAAEAATIREGTRLAPGNLLSSARLIVAGDVTKTESFRTGQVVIQDEASQLIAALVVSGSKIDSAILDCCAAPGGKTLAISDRSPEAVVTAVEVHPHRARILSKLLQQSQSSTPVRVIVADARHFLSATPFDRVLADVPCSGTGTLARNPEIKWRLKPADLADLRQRQIAILRSALDRVAASGRLIYSTCSLEKEENEDVIQDVLNDVSGFRPIDCRSGFDALKASGELVWPDLASLTRGPYLRTIPGIHPCEGFFAAILERT